MSPDPVPYVGIVDGFVGRTGLDPYSGFEADPEPTTGGTTGDGMLLYPDCGPAPAPFGLLLTPVWEGPVLYEEPEAIGFGFCVTEL